MNPQPAPTQPGQPGATAATPLMSVLARRTSCRAYSAAPVPQTALEQILEAARLAPSACNQQPWRFAVVREAAARRRLVEQGFLPGLKMLWALEAPIQVVVGMQTSFITHRLAASVSGVDYPWVDIGIAGEHLVLAAAELGLGTCWIGWIKPAEVRRIVGWPASIRATAIITVGYPLDAATAPLPATRRKPLSEIVKWV
jgi:nitroreductase